MSIQVAPSFKPTCPNHGCPLEGLGFPMKPQGKGICPVSGAPFEYSVELEAVGTAVDKFGNKTKAAKWKVDGND